MVNPVPLYISIKGINSMNFADGMSPMALTGGAAETDVDITKQTIDAMKKAQFENCTDVNAHLKALFEIKVNKGLE